MFLLLLSFYSLLGHYIPNLKCYWRHTGEWHIILYWIRLMEGLQSSKKAIKAHWWACVTVCTFFMAPRGVSTRPYSHRCNSGNGRPEFWFQMCLGRGGLCGWAMCLGCCLRGRLSIPVRNVLWGGEERQQVQACARDPPTHTNRRANSVYFPQEKLSPIRTNR